MIAVVLSIMLHIATIITATHAHDQPILPDMVTSASSEYTGCVAEGGTHTIQAIYAYTDTDHLNERKPQIVQSIRQAAQIFIESAKLQGGYRAPRWAGNCQPSIMSLSVPVQNGNYGDLERYLINTNIAISGSVTVVFAEKLNTCGIQADSDGAHIAMIEPRCWGGHTVAHEIIHALGGVHPGAPHGTTSWHCTDEYDIMCYNDGTLTRPMTYPCAQDGELLLDCGADDYFNLDPSPDSYLAMYPDTNVANSQFLATEPIGYIYLFPMIQN